MFYAYFTAKQLATNPLWLGASKITLRKRYKLYFTRLLVFHISLWESSLLSYHAYIDKVSSFHSEKVYYH
jgi:hypothetical protein